MYLRATAKINLALDVVRKREDGYHEVRMVMQMVGMYDQLYLTARGADRQGNTVQNTAEGAGVDGPDTIAEISPRIRLTTNLSYIPTDEHNLVVKAAKLLMQEKGVTDDLEIRLNKFIPVAAGLAGGSSDAAMTLVGVNRLFHLGLSEEELCVYGKRVGADVPYCILRGTALSEGIGEILTPLPPMPGCSILLSKPAVNVSTKDVYGHLHADAILPEEHPDVDRMTAALKEGNLDAVCAKENGSGRPVMANVLERVTGSRYPVIGEIEREMLSGGALNAIMSGSGPTVFGIFRDAEKAEMCRKVLRRKYPSARTFLTAPERKS